MRNKNKSRNKSKNALHENQLALPMGFAYSFGAYDF